MTIPLAGLVCLQGGAEFGDDCREMDADLIGRAAGPVVVTALAGAVGREYAMATRGGAAYYASLGGDAVAAPDIREDRKGALAALRRARLLVLPGGSPDRLLGLLKNTPVGQIVVDLLANGGIVSGSSAGAMVLGSWTVLPDAGMTLAAGLAAAPGLLVVPHWRGEAASGPWLRAVLPERAADVQVLGLPEQSGVLVSAGRLTAVGRAATRLVSQGRDLAVGASVDLTVQSNGASQ